MHTYDYYAPNPSLVNNEFCNGCIILDDDFLIPKEPHGRKLSNSKHHIMPHNLRNIVLLHSMLVQLALISIHLASLLIFILDYSGPRCITIYGLCAKSVQAIA